MWSRKPVSRASINTFLALTFREKRKMGKKVNQMKKLTLIFTFHVKKSNKSTLLINDYFSNGSVYVYKQYFPIFE